jgi:dynein light chain Tctex-type 1
MANEFAFGSLSDNARSIAERIVKKRLSGKAYRHEKVAGWIERIAEDVVAELRQLSPNFKYCVSCAVLQQLGQGVHSATSCFWDERLDGRTTALWQSKSILCIVHVFASAL